MRGVPRIERSLLRAPALSVASQATGLLQLAALLWRYGPSNATDAYFYLFNLGNLPIQILTVGVLYPLLLSEGRITRAGATRFGLLVPGAGVLAVLVGAGWLGVTDRLDPDIVVIVVLSGVNATLQSMLWFRAVAAEASGAPQWVSAVALPANALALVVLLVPWGSSSATVTAMVVALCVGNALFLAAMLRTGTGRAALDSLPSSRSGAPRGHWWFLAKSGTSYGGVTIVNSLALVLPPSTLTLLTLPMKIVGSVSATFVNAVMPRLVHQQSDSPEAGRRFLRLLVALLVPVGVVGSLGCAVLAPSYLTEAVVVALWLIASSCSSVAQRLAYRFLPPSASRLTIVVVPVIVIAVAVSITQDGFGLIGLLCAYACVDAFSGVLLLASLRDRMMTLVTGAVAAALVVIWVADLL